MADLTYRQARGFPACHDMYISGLTSENRYSEPCFWIVALFTFGMMPCFKAKEQDETR